MSDRYEQPERGSYTDRWDVVLNRNFAEIGDDVDQLFDKLDDTTFVDSAADIKTALETGADGDEIVLGSGDYEVDNPLTINTSIRVTGGGGRGGGTRLLKSNDAPLIEIGNCIPQLEGLILDSEIADTTVGLHSAGTSSNPVFLDKIFATNMGSHGIHLQGANLAGVSNVEAFNNDGNGLHIGPGPDCNAGCYTNINARSNGGHGVYNDGYGNFIQGYAHDSGGDGIRFADSSNNAFAIWGSEGHSGDGAFIESGATNINLWTTVEMSFVDNGDRTKVWGHQRNPTINLYQGDMQAREFSIEEPGNNPWSFRMIDGDIVVDEGNSGSQFVFSKGRDIVWDSSGTGPVITASDGTKYRLIESGGSPAFEQI